MNIHISQYYPTTNKSIQQLLQSRQLLQQLLTIQIPGLAVPLFEKQISMKTLKNKHNSK